MTEHRNRRPAGNRGVSVRSEKASEHQPGHPAYKYNSGDGTWVLPLPRHLMWDGEEKKLNHVTPKGSPVSVAPGTRRVHLIQLRLVQKFKVISLSISVQV